MPLAPYCREICCHQLRVVDELAEVDAFLTITKERSEKLAAFIAPSKFTELVADEAEQDLLRRQFAEMTVAINAIDAYRTTLEERIAAF